ncbi:hypothetical protein A2U01_0090908, partial [Trifolium medium]|nr:hypothetical protein [Trifolium medium]
PLETCQALADPHAEPDPHPPPLVARYHVHHLAPLPPRVSKLKARAEPDAYAYASA